MKVTKRAFALFAGLCVLAAGASSVRADSGGMRFTEGVIDTEYSCSVTIRDYVSNNGDAAFVIDGSVIDVPGLLPDGARPVCGAGFGYMKIADLEDTEDGEAVSLSCTNISRPFLGLMQELLPGGFDAKTSCLPGELLLYAERACAVSEPAVRRLVSLHGVQMQDTDEDGETSAGGLSAGLYLFAEIKSPEGVVPGSPVCLMLPQTNITEMTVGAETYGPGEIWLYDITVCPKSRSLAIDKVIVTGGSGGSEPEYTNSSTACIGDTVTFLVTSDVPKVPDNVKSRLYMIEDIMEKGLSFNGSLSIALGQTMETAETLTEKSDYKVTLTRTEDGGESLLITFTKKGLARLDRIPAASRLYMRCSALVDPDAEIAGDGNRNIARLSYETDHSDELCISSPPVTVHTFELRLKKTFTPAEEHFGNVRFSITSAGEKLSFMKETDGVYHVSCPEDEDDETFLVSPNDRTGLLTIKGLANGTYSITEEETLADYSLLNTPVEMTVKNRNMEINVENKKSIDLVHTGGAGLIGTFAAAAALCIAGILVICHAKKKS